MLHPSSERVRRTIQGTTGSLKSFCFLRQLWSVSSRKVFLHTRKRSKCLGIAAWISQGFAICGKMTESLDERRAVDRQKRNFSVGMINTCNELPGDTVESPSLEDFKTELIKLLSNLI